VLRLIFKDSVGLTNATMGIDKLTLTK